MVATEEQTMGSSIKDHHQYPHLLSIKGKRTKRPRPPSPALITTALTMSTSPSATASYNSTSTDDHEAGGGATRPVTTTTATSSTTTISTEYPTQISDDNTTTVTDEEEDMANCLILLAQGNRNNNTQRLTFSHLQQQPTVGVAATFPKVTSTTIMMGSTPAIAASSSSVLTASAYECKTCNRCFTSFQALGGHRASHKIKFKQTLTPPPPDHDKKQLIPISDRDGHDDDLLSLGIATNASSGINNYNVGVTTDVAPPYNKSKVHECSICGAEFSSGQALGGHMRRHRTLLSGGVAAGASAAAVSRPAVPMMIGDRRIDESIKEEDDDEVLKRRSTFLSLDLNLPAPEDDHRGDQQQSKFVLSNGRTLIFSAS